MSNGLSPGTTTNATIIEKLKQLSMIYSKCGNTQFISIWQALLVLVTHRLSQSISCLLHTFFAASLKVLTACNTFPILLARSPKCKLMMLIPVCCLSQAWMRFLYNLTRCQSVRPSRCSDQVTCPFIPSSPGLDAPGCPSNYLSLTSDRHGNHCLAGIYG